MSEAQRFSNVRVAVPAVPLFGALADMLVRRTLAFAQALRPRHPVAAGLLRRTVLLVWWGFTGQLRRQLSLWLQARRLRRVAPACPAPALLEPVPAETIVVPSSDDPLLSIIIPTYGQTAFTLRCLASIAAHPPSVPFETIVIDDGFPGGEIECLQHVRGIRLQRNSENHGFLRACNVAAPSARGEFLLFLNNDTQVQPGWADAMLALFRARDDVGAVGSKLIYPDGLLQEAGGIIWNDGSGWNFGRHQDAAKPIYNYVREVDYCSGASLMLRHAVFRRLGGFDDRYAPAYFEDADLSFRLRAIGLKTLYQPRSVVVHYEGVSHGRDLNVGIKSCQALNRHRFVSAWSDVLARDHYPNGTHVLRAREQARHRPVVLVVEHEVPQPDRDAGSRAILCVIHALQAAGMVVKFWPQNQFYKPGYVEALQDRAVEVLHGHASFIDWMREFGAELDLVVLSRPDVAEVSVSAVRAHSPARLVYYGHDLHFSRMRMQGTVMGDERLLDAADRMEERERLLWRAVDAVLYLSEEEAAVVRTMVPGAAACAVLPYCFRSFGDERPPPSNHELLFVAGFGHPPNEDAACWLVAEVLPRLRARVPQVTLSIVGSNPTAQVLALAGNGVTVAANLSDEALSTCYRRARVAVVPLRCGAGVKLKVVEALKEGLPLVTTPVGAQGLPGIADVVSVCGDAMHFADATRALLVDDGLWQRRSAGQRAFARERFSETAFQESLMQAIGMPAAGARAAHAATARGDVRFTRKTGRAGMLPDGRTMPFAALE